MVSLLLGSLFLAMGTGRAHSGEAIDAEWAAVVPTIDGVMGPGEWADASLVDLGAIPGNYVRAFMLVKNDDTFLWFAYDAIGDVTNDSDAASFALDAGHDGTASQGSEDQFLLYLNESEHLVYDVPAGYWITEDAPFNPSLPDHAGLAGLLGFGPSDLDGGPHRIFEFQIPLALIGATAGDTVGLFGGSQPAPGVIDDGRGYSTWPDFVLGPIPISQYGDLNLAVAPGPVGVSISPSSASGFGNPGSSVDYVLLVRNRGTAGADTFDLTSLSTWAIGLWDATGANPLVDTDGDSVPDTGSLASAATRTIVVRVDVPSSANGCDVATIIATSSVDTAMWDSSELTTCTGPAAFAPPHSDFGIDTDGDFYYNYLEVDVSLDVRTAGTYTVVAGLFSGDGSVLIEQQYASFYRSVGTYGVPFYFDGRRIFSSGLDGAYRVDLRLLDDLFRVIDTDVHMTQPYRASDFEPPPARFTPPHADRGVDDDVPPNGKFDWLVLGANLQVDQPGNYYIQTTVYDSTGSPVSYAYNNPYLGAGSQVVEIAHSGADIFRAMADGPYRIEMTMYDYFGFFLDSDTHATGPYVHTDFDPPPIAFFPPHSDRGEDADVPPDGLYDFLTVNVSVTIAETADFRVTGELYAPGGWPPLDWDEVIVSLTPGPATVELRFSGPAIRRAGFSGNFEVSLYARKEGVLNASEYDRHTTAHYDFGSFQPPAALFSPPHGDRAVDASVPLDGYKDYVVIDASVDVARAGHFSVEAYVYDDYGRFVVHTLGAADLALGPGSIPVRIDGRRIWETLPSMPLRAYLQLYDENDNELDFGDHTTGAYDPSGFQPPDVDVPSSAATVSGGYLRSVEPLPVDFAAMDTTPSDGIASVALYYRYSPNNDTWFPWTRHSALAGSAGHSQFAGTFQFDLPAGDGYYEFYTIAEDFGGNVEPPPAAPDATAAVFVPARVEIEPRLDTAAAGAAIEVAVRVVSITGQPIAIENPVRVSLLSTSSAGSFRDPGGNLVTEVVIPAGANEVSVDYADTRAGDVTLFAFASGLESGSAVVSIVSGPPHQVTLSPPNAGVAVGSTITFTARVLDSYGNTVANAPLSWSVQGDVGTVASDGVFAAGTKVGAGAVVVESSGLTATAPIVLSPGPPNRVGIFASGYRLAPSGTVIARALAFDANGNVIPGTAFEWSVEGPGTASGTTGDEVTIFATGSGTIRVTARAGSLVETIELIASSGDPAPVAPVGVGGVIVGLVVGFGVGWFLSRRRRSPQTEVSTPPTEEPKAPK